jgi:putative membrane protein
MRLSAMRRLIEIIIVLGTCFVFLLSMASCYPAMDHRGMMEWGYGMGWFGMIFMALFWIAVIVGIVLLILWIIRSGGRPGAKGEDSALGILRERYAKGEISKEEFEEKKKDLSGK